jgi:phosphoribosylformylglycinamidine synthase
MGAKGDLGVELNLDMVPCREDGMTAYEMMLSESQERMLMVLDPSKEDIAEAVFRKWHLDFAVIGKTTDDLRFRIFRHGELMADLPIKELGDQAPEYDRPWVPTPRPKAVPASEIEAPNSLVETLVKMIGLPDMASRRWVWEQYDHLIQGNTAIGPGGDAAVIRIGEGPKALAFTLDVTPRYCFADPEEGGRQAVAECWRNLTAVGAEPLAITDNLNFGNPEKPDIMGQFVGCIQGIGAACKALDFPVVSGNVSLYNETNGKGILPTPAIGAVGLLPDIAARTTIAFKAPGDAIIVIGETKGHLGQSIYARDILGRRANDAPPPVDLAAERRNGDFVRAEIRAGHFTAVHDASDGGLLVALAEMAMAGGVGASVTADPALAAHAWAFGEDQGRYVVTLPEKDAADLMERAQKASVSATQIGVTGGNELTLAGSAPISLKTLKDAHEGWFPSFMAGPDLLDA